MTSPPTLEPIPLSPGIKERLFALYRGHESAVAPILEADAVAAAESCCRLPIPDDVRAYLAVLGAITTSASPLEEVLRGESEIDLFYGSLDPPRRAWRKQARFDHVPFEAWGDWPRLYATIARDPKRKRFAVLSLKSMSFEAELDTFAEYLEWRWAAAPSPQEPGAYWLRTDAGKTAVAKTPFDLPSIDLHPNVPSAVLDAFVPAMRHRPRRDTARRVSHKKFGIGVVRREADGKCEVDFGENGIRTLAASFLEDVT